MATTSQTTVSASSPLSPQVLVQRLVQALHGAADVSTTQEETVLVLPPAGSPIGDSPVGSVHLRPGSETLMLDCTAPDSTQLTRVEELVSTRLRTVDVAAAGALDWRRHE
ncbi:hypothetical protein WDZ17_03020 [Pseudokineococcus basanitobsidens]|uniref:DUF2218 domain-containing protein n=1 Tax=Pseudokineococcus basanitobsidens TaxID=1926649 RepID=A0ABU8RGR7_9ACTN